MGKSKKEKEEGRRSESFYIRNKTKMQNNIEVNSSERKKTINEAILNQRDLQAEEGKREYTDEDRIDEEVEDDRMEFPYDDIDAALIKYQRMMEQEEEVKTNFIAQNEPPNVLDFTSLMDENREGRESKKESID